MEDTSNSVMLALLPITSDWCHIELPHCTLVYVGKKNDLEKSVFNELAKDASMLALLSNPITLKVLGVEVFGELEKVNVLRLQPSQELWAMRRVVEKWNASEFPFKPHATIGPIGSMIDTPRYLAFDRLMVSWGEDNLTFSLKTNTGY